MDAAGELRQLRTDGWCVVKKVIPGEEVEVIRRSVLETTERFGDPEAKRVGVGHVVGFMSYDQCLAPYVAEERLMAIAQSMLGTELKISFSTGTTNYPGNERGELHADWPFNQRNAGHIPQPYPDATMHLTTLWMLSDFTEENGGTVIVPGSHRSRSNPTGDSGVEPMESHPTEMNATGAAGSVLVIDSRLWHATARNRSDAPRVSVVIRYAPWWLNTKILMPGSSERARMVDEAGAHNPEQPALPARVFETLPEEAKPLFEHWVDD